MGHPACSKGDIEIPREGRTVRLKPKPVGAVKPETVDSIGWGQSKKVARARPLPGEPQPLCTTAQRPHWQSVHPESMARSKWEKAYGTLGPASSTESAANTGFLSPFQEQNEGPRLWLRTGLGGLPWRSGGLRTRPAMQGTWVWSLDGGRRSHMPWGS